MCYADTTTNADGTATAFCYCGWGDDYADHAAADVAAAEHARAAADDEARFERECAAV